jgi:hypothetical protein
MKYSWRQPMQTKGSAQAPAMSGGNGKNNGGSMTGIEKGFSEAFLFIFSVVLHLSHSLEGEHGARL